MVTDEDIEDDEETLAWEGEDPTPRDQPKGVSVFPLKLDFAFNRIKIYIDSPAVPGWNEIDAVGLRDADGETQWATDVVASTSFGITAAETQAFVPNNNRYDELKAELDELRKEVKELSKLREDIAELKKLLKDR